ncbi:MAG: hypothetical protein KQH79_07055 [Bacteroidetes bacterium]|nr:hypothetical protein [Bacteroidota bacterium]
MKNLIVILNLFLGLNSLLNAQVTISKTNVDYSLKLEKDSIVRILTFYKVADSSFYHAIHYAISDFSHTGTEFILKNEIEFIQQLWNMAEDSISLELRSANIGYPLEYSDVLANHIQAFLDSEQWQKHITQNGKKLDYEIIKTVMLKQDVYKPFHDFLKSKGYHISGFSTEKHGFVTKENLQKAGFAGNEIIPMPFMVWIILSK